VFGASRDNTHKKQLTPALRAIPNNADVFITAGALARREGKWPEALKNVEQARDRDPRSLSVLWDLFATCLAVHDYAKAEKTASDALSISSTAPFFILARAAVALFRNGDTAPLRAALRQVPPNFDPGGSTSTIALRVSLMERDLE